MNCPKFIAGRLRFSGKTASLSIAVSFLVIILAVSVSSGFRSELRDAIASLSGDIRLTSPSMDYMAESSPIIMDSVISGTAAQIPAIASVNPVIYRAGIVRKEDNIHGVLFKGSENGPDSLGLCVPSKLCELLGLEVGDELPAWFVGERVKVRKFRIESVYKSMLSGNDNLIVHAGLEDMRRLNGWKEGEVSAVEILLKENKRSNKAVIEARNELGHRLLMESDEDYEVPYASSSKERFPQIFAWLDLIDLNVLLILGLMIVVAGFNMISGLLILLFRNISTIGTLKSLGMTDKAISETFLRVSSNLLLKGMAAGNILAFAFCFVQSKTHLLKLNPDNYFISYVPVELKLLHILAADAVAYLAIMLLLLLPSMFISKVDPAKTVRVK